MDVYGMSSAGQDVFGVDDLFDFSGDGDELFTSSTATNLFSSSTVSGRQLQYNIGDNYATNNGHHHSTDFTDHFCVPSDDVAEHEWLSNFVNDSTTNFPTNNIAETINFRPETSSFHSRSRTKRTRAPSTTTTTWTSPPSPPTHIFETSPETSTDLGVVRRCSHCASEKTPQWRTGPLGPKTLCNACGVRYKSGRLVPEYRPAASPTFVLTQHSNSHRKVMELRRQKEMILGHQSHHHHPQQQQVFSPEQKTYSGKHHHQIC